MTIAKPSHLPRHTRNSAPTPALDFRDRLKPTLSVPGIVTSALANLELGWRAHLLGRLLGSVGPLALAVIGGGVFAKFLPDARLPVVPVSFEDAALATSSQVHELVSYVEQSNPSLIEGLMDALLQDGVVVTALGASIAATQSSRSRIAAAR